MISDLQRREYTEKIKELRARLLLRYPFFGILASKMRFGLDPTIGTAATDGSLILLDPSFALTDRELDFVVMHELLHIALDHLSRGSGYDKELFNIACDIVVNSTIMHVMRVSEFAVAGSNAFHKAPDGTEGYEHTAEEIYAMLLSSSDPDGSGGKGKQRFSDSHSRWDKMSRARREEMARMVKSAAASVRQISGSVPASVGREMAERRNAQLDWRQILAEFVQEDVYDYTFSKPDKRFSGELVMPDFDVTDFSVNNILFMIDTSGSMSDKEISAAFSEVCGAVDQFGGRLSGLLGFFDCEVTPPVPFESVGDILKIRPVGGGGTSADPIFDYIDSCMSETPPSSVIILTDGFMSFPDEKRAGGIPVLWIIDSAHGPAPKWGTVVRMNT